MSSVADCIPSQGIDFGYCGVSQTTTKTLTLTNPYNGIVKYEIQTENSPFQISPLSGMFEYSIIFVTYGCRYHYPKDEARYYYYILA